MDQKKFFTLAQFIGNEWITTTLLMKFIEDYCFSYVNNSNIFNVNARFLFNNVSIYIIYYTILSSTDLLVSEP